MGEPFSLSLGWVWEGCSRCRFRHLEGKVDRRGLELAGGEFRILRMRFMPGQESGYGYL